MKRFIGAVAALFSVLLVSTNSFAVLTADQLLVTGAVDTMIADMSTWAWTAILAVMTFVIGAKLFKRFMGSAT